MFTVCQGIQLPLFFWRLRVRTSLVIIFQSVTTSAQNVSLYDIFPYS